MAPIKDNFIYVPSIGLYVARERSHDGKNWHEAHEALAKEDSRMLTIPEFVKFLNYLRENPSHENTQFYDNITQIRNHWRSEWLDAYFEKRKSDLYVLTGNKTNAKKLEKALMIDKLPGISLDDWLSSPTPQGLPKTDVAKGDLHYWYPRDGCVARFYAFSERANLNCDGSPSGRGSTLGVIAAKQRDSSATSKF